MSDLFKYCLILLIFFRAHFDMGAYIVIVELIYCNIPYSILISSQREIKGLLQLY